MALAVDSFEHLVKEISFQYRSLFRLDFKSWTVKDVLAAVGTGYVTYKALVWSCKAYAALKEYGISRLAKKPSLVRTYGGTWAVVTGSGDGIGRAYAEELAGYGMHVVIVSLGQNDCEVVARHLVVTGCTRGIGEAFVDELASYGLNVVLIARCKQRLHDVAFHLEREYGVQTCVVAVDFNDGARVYNVVREALQGKDVAILVNNVGVMYDYPQYFLDVPEDKLWSLLYVNVAAATMMTQLVLPQMVERKKGAVVTVSSGSCSLPTPQMTVYSATKAYLDYFMKGLAFEYRGSGVTFQTLMPFYVATRMTRYSSTLSHTSLWIPSASDYAQQAVRTLGWGCRTAGYWPHCIQTFIVGCIPERCWMWGANRLNCALRRQATQRRRHRSSQGRLPSSVSEGSLRSVASGSAIAQAPSRSRSRPDLVTSADGSSGVLRKLSVPTRLPGQRATLSSSDTASSFVSATSQLSDPGQRGPFSSGDSSFDTPDGDRTPTSPSNDDATPTASGSVFT